LDINLRLKSLKLTNFKNYETANLEFSDSLNCIVGENGMGKTNLLDAIHLLCLAKSHFQYSDKQLIKIGEDFYRVEGKFRRLDKKEQIVAKYQKGKRKTFERNKSVYKKLADHIGLMPLVIIAPDDAQLILEGSEERRRFMDFSLVQLDKLYLQHLMQYNKTLSQRNALLKSASHPLELDFDLLETYDKLMEPAANYIFEKRSAFIQSIYPVFQEYYQAISGGKEEVELSYRSQLEDATLAELFQAARDKDAILQRTTKGVQKDDLKLEIKGQKLKDFGSQGQLKSYLLAMKLAQYELLRKEQQITPILLLDDIFDKLDAKRVRQLLDLLLERSFGQIFITDTHQDRVENILQNVKYKTNYKKFVIQDAKVVDEVSATP
jgi:DNA replication and repair protein RecF